MVLSNQSKLDFYLNIGDINSVSELVSGVVSSLNEQATQSGGDEDSELHSKVSRAGINRVVFTNAQVFLKTFYLGQITKITTSLLLIL